jgi:hypothetical protein
MSSRELVGVRRPLDECADGSGAERAGNGADESAGEDGAESADGLMLSAAMLGK